MRNQDRLKQNTPDPAAQVNHQYTPPTDIVKLPSAGKFYSKEHPLHKVEEVEVGFMTTKEEDILVKFLEDKEVFLYKNRLTILFESDFDAKGLSKFISRLNPDLFGINYDIGNSAALGFDATEEIDCYGYRIKNVHVKDRLLGGTTVPLGMGNADFIKVFSNLNRVGYKGNFILQTARSTDGDHLGVLRKFREMTANWISHSGT